MPKYLPLTPEQQAAVKAAGADASQYVFDTEAGDAVRTDTLPPTTWGEELSSGLKSIAPGAADALMSPVGLAGSVADLVRMGVGTYDPNNPSEFTKLSKGVRSGVEDLVGQPDLRASWLSTGIGRGVGNLLGTMSGAGLGRKVVGKFADVAARRIAGGIGGSMMAEFAIDRELEQQRQAGVVDPLKAGAKGLVSGLGGGYLEQKFGAGGLMKNLEAPAQSGLDALKRAGLQALFGAGTEAGQQALENYLITGGPQLMDERYSPLKAGVIGGLVQGPTSLAGDKLRGWPSAEERALTEKVDRVVAKEQAEDQGRPAGLSALMGTRGKTEKVDTTQADVGGPAYVVSPGTAEAMIRAGKDWKPPITTPVDSAFTKLAAAGVAVTPDEIQDLYNAWGGQKEGVQAVERLANDIYAKHQLVGPSKPVDPLDLVSQRAERRSKYSGQRAALSKELEGLQKELETAPLGTKQIILAKIREVESDIQTITQQESVDLAAMQPVLPTKGMANPVIPAGALPGIGETGVGTPNLRQAIPLGPVGSETIGEGGILPREMGPQLPVEGPAPKPVGFIEKPQIPLRTGGPILAGAPAEQKLLPYRASESSMDYARRIGFEAIARARAQGVKFPAEIERLMRDYRAEQEGEQSGPFGEGQTRYSTIFPPSILEKGKELARRARQWLNEDQVQAGTYMLSGVAGLNQERPWGMQLAGDGSLPTSGLVPKMAANIPKGEMEAYKAAGLEKWLEGKGKVSREELQKWMMENGPQVEVKELRPGLTSAETQERAKIEHQLDTQFGNWSDALDPSAKVRQDFFARNPKAEPLVDRYLELNATRRRESSDSTIGRYNVEPRPVEEMEGPVELLVRVPFKDKPFRSYKRDADEQIIDPVERREALEGQPLWTGGHHGASGYNTLGFGRANIETLPDGRRVLHVFEAQSDWGQRVRKEQEDNKARVADLLARMQPIKDENGRDGYMFVSSRGEFWAPTKEALLNEINREAAATVETPSHPLLDESNRLILKAAIKYAVDNNLDGIAISDAETAMITEGHDTAGSLVQRVSPEKLLAEISAYLFGIDVDNKMRQLYGDDWKLGTYVEFYDRSRKFLRLDRPNVHRNSRDAALAQELHDAGYGQKEGVYIPQEGGMRLNYDQKLPKIAKELTGHEGERVSFGEHWKAVEKVYNTELPMDERAEARVQHQFGNLTPAEYDAALGTHKAPRKNLVFKNPDGSPKTDITARVYPLDKARRMFDEQTAFTLFGRDQSYYSTFGPSKETLQALGKVLSGLGFSPSTKSLDPFYKLTQSVTSRMASLSPAGGVWKWFHGELVREETKLLHALATAARPLEPFLKSEKGKMWLNRASTEKTWDNYAGLTDAEARQAAAVAEYVTQLNEVMRSRGIRVGEIGDDGKIAWRDRKDLPGYFPWTVSDQVYDAFARGGKESEDLRGDFIAAWIEAFGEGREAQAEEAMDNLLGVRGQEVGPGGEPLFGPVSLPHGMTLPESWRGKNPAESLNRYLKRTAKHLAWAEVVQYNPVGRVLMGLKNDPAGNDTAETDLKTWAEAPDMWKYAVREGKRARGEWALNASDVAPDEPIRKFGDSKLLTAMLASYKQASMPAAVMQAANSAASAAIMQAATGLRDVGMSAVLAAQYAGPIQAARSMLASIIEPGKKIEEARAAGAMPGDLLTPETELNARVVARSLMKFARGMRKISGREFLDNLGRTMIYDSVKSVIMEGSGDHLVKEFGPVNAEGLSRAEIAEQTAARISHRASNVADAGSLPEFMLPQSSMSWAFALARWSVSQYNNFSEDVVNPALRSSGKEQMRRFLTLMVGSVVGGSVINGLLDDLFKRKPDHLTWGEWLRVYGDNKVDNATKAKEFAYTAASRMQVMGALGWVGDYLIAPAARELAGGSKWARSTDIQYPAWIVALQAGDILGSYYNAMKNGRTDGSDFLDLLLEMVKLNQNAKIAGAGMEALGLTEGKDKKGLRDQAVVQRLYDVNPATGRMQGPEAGQRPAFRADPFSFTHQAMEGDIQNMRGFLQERRRSGNIPTLDSWSQSAKYYRELERLVGEEEARKRREEDRRMDREVRKKNREIRRLSR